MTKYDENGDQSWVYVTKTCSYNIQRNFSAEKKLKGTSRQRSGKGAIRKRYPLQKPRWEETKLTIRYFKRMGSYFLNRWPLSYLNLTKNMKTYIRHQKHNFFFKHQDTKRKNHRTENYFGKKLIFSIFLLKTLIVGTDYNCLAQNIDCGYRLELPCRWASNEYPQSMFWITNMKNRYIHKSGV